MTGLLTGADAAVDVVERAGSPSVDQLVVTNRSPRPVLLLAGELLEGGWQSRTLTASTVLAPATPTVLPVLCVEHGRWGGGTEHRRGARRAPLALRPDLERPDAQQRLWDRVPGSTDVAGPSPTDSLLDRLDRTRTDAGRLTRGLAPLAGQSGVLIGIAGRPVALELFGSRRALAAHWTPLLDAATLDALGRPPVRTTAALARALGRAGAGHRAEPAPGRRRGDPPRRGWPHPGGRRPLARPHRAPDRDRPHPPRPGGVMTMPRSHRAAGAVIGSAVGDALGAPFEFGPPGRFSAQFSSAHGPDDARGTATEMCGGGSLSWEPGEFTDDTQMALLVARSLVERGGLDEADLFDRFRRWADAPPPDIGNQTGAVLGSGRPWDVAASEHFARSGHAAGNGSLMRTTPAAVFFAPQGRAATMDAARRMSALTHGDPSVGEGCAVFHELVRVALDGGDPLAAVPEAMNHVAPEHRRRWAAVLDRDWTPADATETNGAVWPTLGQAVWALRGATSFAQVMRRVIDLGGDTDTVAAVAGGLAGAVFGIAGIPMRWTSVVHGRVPGFGDHRWDLPDLHALTAGLTGGSTARYEAPETPGLEPREIADGVWASDLDGARRSSREFAVVSLCRTGEPFGHDVQRFAYLTDDDANTELDAVLADVLDDMAALRAEGRPVLVHCFAGQSRTGLVLRAWLRRTEGLFADEATARVAQAWPHLGLWNDSFTAALERVR